MTKEIVHTRNKEIFTDSKVIADMLEVDHQKVMQTIDRMFARRKKNTLPQKPLKFPQKFIETTFINKMGRSYKMYDLNEQAYLKLSMQLSGYEKAEIVQDQIIEAFSMMKQEIQNKSNSEWITSRKQGIIARNDLTDTIKDFVDYATKQGSNSAFRYYGTITKETYKSLSLIANNEKVDTSFRDSLAAIDLAFLQVAEYVAMGTFRECMDNNLHYKEIYQIAKAKVLEYAKTITIKKIKG